MTEQAQVYHQIENGEKDAQTQWEDRSLSDHNYSSVEVTGEQQYGGLGGEITLTPKVSGQPEDILWKHNGNKVVEFDGSQNVEYGRYKGRTVLDWDSGELSIKGLTDADSGPYELEAVINGKLQYSQHEVDVIDDVAQPSVTCVVSITTPEKMDRTLLCSADLQPLTKFIWRSPGGSVSPGPELFIAGGENQESVYTCVVKNPVSEKTAEFTLKDCYAEEGSSSVLAVILSIIIILLILVTVLVLLWRWRKGKKLAEAALRKSEEEARLMKVTVQGHVIELFNKQDADANSKQHTAPTGRILSPTKSGGHIPLDRQNDRLSDKQTETEPVQDKPTPAQPDLVTPDPTLAQPDPVTPDPTLAQPDPVTPVPTLAQPDPVTPVPTLAQPDPVTPDPTPAQPDLITLDPTLAQPDTTPSPDQITTETALAQTCPITTESAPYQKDPITRETPPGQTDSAGTTDPATAQTDPGTTKPEEAQLGINTPTPKGAPLNAETEKPNQDIGEHKKAQIDLDTPGLKQENKLDQESDEPQEEILPDLYTGDGKHESESGTEAETPEQVKLAESLEEKTSQRSTTATGGEGDMAEHRVQDTETGREKVEQVRQVDAKTKVDVRKDGETNHNQRDWKEGKQKVELDKKK
ncbi:unnamed protein product [Coregonus sp. 'balchen']|nr:unnamed protein product [Coregonus sp. 'balchen']